MLDKLGEIERRYEAAEADYQNPAVLADPREMQRLGKLRAELGPVVEAVRAYRKALDELAQAESLLADPEMADLAKEEIPGLKTEIEALERSLKGMLVPKDPQDEKPVIVEIRPAAGGDEAGLFAGELVRMYLRYAERHRWKVDVLEHDENGMGGVNRSVFNVKAEGAFSRLKHEMGVHRVQRVPATESQGRIHTSTVTVAVMPEAEEVELHVDPKELEISTFCSSSAGGQHMQKNETAIRIIHKPTGLVSTCQDERSQAQNKIKAMAVLRSKLLQMRQDAIDQERGALRKGQIGTGDRSEKIRTYNFPQSRITDHRISYQVNNVGAFMDGDLDDLLSALGSEEQARRLAAESGA